MSHWSRYVLWDEPFQYCTKFVCQPFTIHGIVNNYYILLVFFSLKDRTDQIYLEAFSTLNNLRLKIFDNFKQKLFM